MIASTHAVPRSEELRGGRSLLDPDPDEDLGDPRDDLGAEEDARAAWDEDPVNDDGAQDDPRGRVETLADWLAFDESADRRYARLRAGGLTPEAAIAAGAQAPVARGLAKAGERRAP